ncbi:FAM98A [Micractinium conductrix]|uniref:FAM98A n=1 Tax=Micractinium conductrix TaxID=554055 RepID=A0A2P6VHR0_9CHLO|nr:FAM98A [Micractinium conductrix]|eukprot:PSC73625.1 FAM98A [Micractinium conductrix]
MAVSENRAGDLLDRLADCGLGDGMSEDDLMSAATREPLRACCVKLAGRLWALLSGPAGPPEDPRALQAAAVALRRAADTEAAAGEGRLDAALNRLAATVDPGWPTGQGRLPALELLVAAAQAGAMVAAGAGADESQLPDADDGAEDLDTTDPLAYELSAALRGIAALLQLELSGAASGSAAALASAALARAQQLLAQLPAGFFEPLLPAGLLGGEQMAKLSEVDAALRYEYALRRRMLIERVNVTLQSFLWSPRLEQKGTKAEAAAVAEAAAKHMPADPQVQTQDVFTATLADLLAILEKATSGETGITASVKSVLIGKVPDRGGRPEGRRREAEMPEWTARRVTHGGSGRGGGHHGHGRGRGGGGKSENTSGGGGGRGRGGGGGRGKKEVS